MLVLALVSVVPWILPGVSSLKPPQKKDSDALRVAGELLKSLGEKDLGDLRNLRVQLSETRPAKGREKEKLLFRSTFSMSFPNHCRVEETAPGSPIRIYLWEGDKLITGPGGGPFVEVRGEARERLLRRIRLIAALFCWDLLPGNPAPRLQERVLHSTLRLGPKSPPLPVRRILGDELEIRALVVGKQKYRLSGRLPGVDRVFPRTLRALPGSVFEVLSWASGFDYPPRFFQPKEATPSHALVQQGGEQKNFDSPRLKRLPPSYEISVKDPGDWKARARLLDQLGRRLFALGQEPAGLPLYGRDGKIRIQFLPSEGKKAQAPKPFQVRALPKRLALVLYAKGPFLPTMKKLEKTLREKAKAMGVGLAGTFLVIPTYFPSPEGPFPSEKDALVLRGELLLK